MNRAPPDATRVGFLFVQNPEPWSDSPQSRPRSCWHRRLVSRRRGPSL